MKSFQTYNEPGCVLAGIRLCVTVFSGLLLAVSFGMGRTAIAQAVPAGDGGGVSIFAGATASGFSVQYGEQKMLGVSTVVDADTRRSIGLEGEARWLLFHETEDVHVTTWLAGPRYHRSMGKFQIYGKGLVGVGEFTFPYNYAHGSYLVIAPGGGVDYAITHRFRLRVADAEYQYWPQFTFGPMSSFGISTGLRIRVF
jgi:hypothetical protein